LVISSGDITSTGTVVSKEDLGADLDPKENCSSMPLADSN